MTEPRPGSKHRGPTTPGHRSRGGAAQAVGGRVVRAAIFPLWRGGVIPGGGSAAVAAIMTAWGAVTPSAGTGSGSARIVVAGAVCGEKCDGPAEVVADRAPDNDAFQGPVGGAHSEPVPDLGRQPASQGALLVQAGRAVNEHLRGLRPAQGVPFPD